MDHRQMTEHARKVVVTVSTAWSFDRCSQKLKDLCGMHISDDTIERVCQEEGDRALRWQAHSPDPVKQFTSSPGRPEFYSDGLKINTTEGWREMRLNLLQKRKPAAPARPEQWTRRVLPEASVRLASCAIADCQHVGASWGRLSERMGLTDSDELSVIADGARWIWDQAGKHLSKKASWCVDVYHVSEHLHACGKSMFGEGAAARSWAQRRLEELIATGGPKFIAGLDQQIKPTSDATSSEALMRLRAYLNDNRDSLWYAQRLAAGLPIGSGPIEGACKKMGGRLKLNSARWRTRRAERFGALLCLDYTDQTAHYWRSRAA
jgi:hypothetical protein